MRRSAKIPKPSPPSPPYRRICAWCQADLGSLWVGSTAHSYGICLPCIQRYFPDLYESDGPVESARTVPDTPDAQNAEVEDADTASAKRSRTVASQASERD
jgi:hypothetical protein